MQPRRRVTHHTEAAVMSGPACSCFWPVLQVMVPGTEVSEGGSVVDARPLPMGAVPLALTCGLRRGHLIADPTSAEEGLMEALITAILDHEGRIIGEPN